MVSLPFIIILLFCFVLASTTSFVSVIFSTSLVLILALTLGFIIKIGIAIINTIIAKVVNNIPFNCFAIKVLFALLLPPTLNKYMY